MVQVLPPLLLCEDPVPAAAAGEGSCGGGAASTAAASDDGEETRRLFLVWRCRCCCPFLSLSLLRCLFLESLWPLGGVRPEKWIVSKRRKRGGEQGRQKGDCSRMENQHISTNKIGAGGGKPAAKIPTYLIFGHRVRAAGKKSAAKALNLDPPQRPAPHPPAPPSKTKVIHDLTFCNPPRPGRSG